METITLHPQNKEQLNAIKAFAKALKVPLAKVKNPSPSGDEWFLKPENMAIAENAIAEFEKNPESGTRVSRKDFKNLLGL